VYPGFSSGAFNLGGETWIKWLQEYTLYQVGTSTYEQMVANFIPYYLKNGLKDFLEQQREWRRGILRNEQLLADIRAKALSTSGDRAVSEWIRYATLKEGRQIKPEVQHYQQMLFIQKATVPGNVGPYEYSETVLEKVRQRVKSATAKAI